MATAKGGRKRARPTPADAPTRLVEAALKLAALQGWDDTGMGEIATEAGVPLAEARAHFASKEALLDGFVARIDQAMLAGVSEDLGGEPVRDRLFDVIMRRFDAMAPYKDGIAAILRDHTRDPLRLLCFVSGPIRRSLDWILAAADAPSWGPLQPLQRKGLGLVFANALRIWLRDDSPDLAKTMAAVDKGLARAESVLRLLPRDRRQAADVTPDAPQN
jgi:AcrR family transcriptional regulator